MTDDAVGCSMSEVLVVGESLIDVVRYPDGSTHAAPGGSPANVAVALGRLGREVSFVTQWGADEYGALLCSWLAESNVDIVNVGPSHAPTSLATAVLDEEGSASYEFSFEWDIEEIPSWGGFLHVGSLAALQNPGAQQVRRLVEQASGRIPVSYDPNIRPRLVGDRSDAVQSVEAFVRLSDVVKTSEEDLEFLYSGSDPMVAAEKWSAMGPGIVVVTRAEQGAVIVTEGERQAVEGIAVPVVDTVGAGDTFMAAFIDGLLRSVGGRDMRTTLRAMSGEQLERLARRAVGAATVTVSRCGMDPPFSAELEAFV
ncbi:carbohydrate kinase family protein [Nesterenkonia sp. K-15-9-6]|uniref:carbohydrate kinase family protein n=1 Tax=Nesterenkonia sp. K-15-9-6 TaxID=3093918 RepID=UPI004044BDB0